MSVVTDNISLAKISQSLWTTQILKDNAFRNGSINTGRDLLLYMQRKALDYGSNQSLSGLDGVSNGVYHLCGAKLQLASQIFSNASTGGTVLPTTGLTNRTYQYFFVVGQTGSLVANGGSSFVLGLGSNAQFTNFIGLFTLTIDQTPMPYTTDVNYEGFQLSFNGTTGDLTVSLANGQTLQNGKSVFFNMAYVGSQQPTIAPVL